MVAGIARQDIPEPNPHQRPLRLTPSAAAALQAIDGDKEVGPSENFNQSVKDALVIVRSRL
jgi:hypothetical protein